MCIIHLDNGGRYKKYKKNTSLVGKLPPHHQPIKNAKQITREKFLKGNNFEPGRQGCIGSKIDLADPDRTIKRKTKNRNIGYVSHCS